MDISFKRGRLNELELFDLYLPLIQYPAIKQTDFREQADRAHGKDINRKRSKIRDVLHALFDVVAETISSAGGKHHSEGEVNFLAQAS